MDLFSLQWLLGDKIVSAKYDENANAWSLYFHSGACLYIECLWRLLEENKVLSTSEDHGHLFGSPEAFDGAAALTLMNAYPVAVVTVREGTQDLIIKFGDFFVLEVLVSSAGYASRSVFHPDRGAVFSQAGRLYSDHEP